MIRLDKVSKFYKTQDSVSVGMKKVSLSFNLNEFVAITGESGSGKSTLLNVISGLDGYEEGEFYLFGEETSHFTISDWEKYRGAYVGFVFQNYNIIDSYTVLQNVLLALEIQGYPKKDRKGRALHLIDQVGLTSHKNHKASKLSGGQKQRCVIARALAKDCPIIVADEPTGNLDSESSKQVIDLLYGISKEKLVIIVTHDYEQVEKYATRKIKMHDGEVVEDKRLKKTKADVEIEKITPKKMGLSTLFRFAIRNLLATPRRLLFIVMMQMLVAGVFIIVYSNQVQSIREAGLQQSTIYPSTPATRLLVEKRDGTSFTESELNAIKANRYVNKNLVYRYAANFYNTQELSLFSENDPYLYNQVVGTDTAKALRNSDFTGRLPIAKNEVIISDYNGRFEIGDEVYLYPSAQFSLLSTQPNASGYSKFTVTGIHKSNNRILYFSDAFLNQDPSERPALGATSKEEFFNFNLNSLQMSFNIDGIINYLYIIDKSDVLTGRTIEDFGGLDLTEYKVNVNIVFYNHKVDYTPFEVEFDDVTLIINRNNSRTGYISTEFLTEIIDEIYDEYLIRRADVNENENIISVNVASFRSGENFIKSLDQSLYRVYYPASLFSPMRPFLVFFQTLLAIMLMTFFGLFLYSLVHAVSKNIMRSRQKDFAIYRSIGTNQTILARLIVVEQIIQSLFAFILTFIVLYILQFNVDYIASSIRYMMIQDYLILIIAFAGFGAWLGLRYNKRIFKYSVIESLTMSREE